MFEPFTNTPERAALGEAVRDMCDRFDDDYWARKDQTHFLPLDCSRAIAEGGWLRIAMPAEYGGAGPFARTAAWAALPIFM